MNRPTRGAVDVAPADTPSLGALRAQLAIDAVAKLEGYLDDSGPDGYSTRSVPDRLASLIDHAPLAAGEQLIWVYDNTPDAEQAVHGCLVTDRGLVHHDEDGWHRLDLADVAACIYPSKALRSTAGTTSRALVGAFVTHDGRSHSVRAGRNGFYALARFVEWYVWATRGGPDET